MTVEPGEFCAVVGPSGCGKSTTLTMVAGLDQASEGTVSVGGQPVTGIGRGTSFMFQTDALLPWKTVLGNVALGPLFRGVPKKQALTDARDWLRMVGLTGFEDHHPHQLSGGMRKRVALAAALINEPSILLMDEPFGALDVQTKAIMSTELLTLWDQSRPSVIFVTHDLEEAIALADKVVVMTAGPGTVKAVFDIDLPRPRGSVQEIRFGQRFTELHHEIWELAARRGDAGLRADLGPGRSRGHRRGGVVMTSRRGKVLAAQIAVLIFVFGGWQLFTTLKIVDPFFFGKPSGIVSQAVDWVRHGTSFGSIWLQIETTMEEAVLGFLIGVACGIVAGVLLGQVRFLSEVFSPYIKAVNALPRIVLGTLFIIILGLGMSSKVVLAAFLVFFVVFFNAFQGVREVDGNLINNARVLGASRMQLVRTVVIPSAMTWIIASLHVAFGFAVIGAVVGEVLGAQHGLGVLISDSANNFNANGVFAGMIIIGALALVAEWLISLLERRVLAWRPQMATEASAV